MAGPTDLDIDITVVVEADLETVPAFDPASLSVLAELVLRSEAVTGTWRVAFVLVDDARLTQLHRDFMGIDEPTDVMTFEQDADDGEPGESSSGGDIIVSVERAVDQAGANGNTPERELLFLAVHGLLHLTGWVDHTAEQRAAMLAHGEDLLRRFETDRPGERLSRAT